jgi:hypothetical protein
MVDEPDRHARFGGNGADGEPVDAPFGQAAERRLYQHSLPLLGRFSAEFRAIVHAGWARAVRLQAHHIEHDSY